MPSTLIDAAEARRLPLRPADDLRGAPAGPLLANPTFWVLVASLTLFSVGAAAALTDAASAWVTVPVSAVGIYLGFTVMHDAVHRTAHPTKRINDAMGWLPALLLYFTLPMFRTCHSKHHANTNDPDNDPDHSVARMPAVLRVWWLFFTVFNYRRLYYGRKWWRSRAELAAQVVLDVVMVGGGVVVAVTDTFDLYAQIHLLPALLAGLFLFYAFDFLPHAPHDSRERYLDTRVQPGPVRHAILLGQNYHLVHHLWVTIPWYRYRDAFEQLRPELEARGARID